MAVLERIIHSESVTSFLPIYVAAELPLLSV